MHVYIYTIMILSSITILNSQKLYAKNNTMLNDNGINDSQLFKNHDQWNYSIYGLTYRYDNRTKNTNEYYNLDNRNYNCFDMTFNVSLKKIHNNSKTKSNSESLITEMMNIAFQGTVQELLQFFDQNWYKKEDYFKKVAVLDLKLMISMGKNFKLKKMEKDNHYKITLYYQNSLTDSYDQVSLTLSESNSDKIRRVQVHRSSKINKIIKRELNETEKFTEIDKYITQLYESNAFSGVVLISKKGIPKYEKFFGYSNYKKKIPFVEHSAFNLASLNKIITATAIMQLVEKNQLKLTDKVKDLLPKEVKSEEAGKIQVKHFLSHTSGLNSELDSLKWNPGTKFEYNNGNFWYLGLIIEEITGMSYDDYIHLSILSPSGMANTGSFKIKTSTDLLVSGYEPEIEDNKFVLVENPWLQRYEGTSVGGYYSSAQDLLKFANALQNGTLISIQTLDLMKTAKSELMATEYGYGVLLWKGNGVWGHSGNLPGADSDLEILGNTGYTVVILGNKQDENKICFIS